MSEGPEVKITADKLYNALSDKDYSGHIMQKD